MRKRASQSCGQDSRRVATSKSMYRTLCTFKEQSARTRQANSADRPSRMRSPCASGMTGTAGQVSSPPRRLSRALLDASSRTARPSVTTAKQSPEDAVAGRRSQHSPVFNVFNSACNPIALAQTSSFAIAMGNTVIGTPTSTCSRRSARTRSNSSNSLGSREGSFRARCRAVAGTVSTLLSTVARTVAGKVSCRPSMAISPKEAPSP
mmetsp:Transcript_20935/g.49708  ORF Transcript_20935/g.49708 Transcript_20935/m.49708 type:complete len:207 (-) Transcript_20935:2911-3531(-)